MLPRLKLPQTVAMYSESTFLTSLSTISYQKKNEVSIQVKPHPQADEDHHQEPYLHLQHLFTGDSLLKVLEISTKTQQTERDCRVILISLQTACPIKHRSRSYSEIKTRLHWEDKRARAGVEKASTPESIQVLNGILCSASDSRSQNRSKETRLRMQLNWETFCLAWTKPWVPFPGLHEPGVVAQAVTVLRRWSSSSGYTASSRPVQDT